MESRLSPPQWQVILRMRQAAQASAMNLYLVGGAVRDLIGGYPIDDFDFAVDGKALKLLRPLERDGASILSKDKKLQEAELQFPSGVLASLSMTRSETFLKPGAPPVIAPASILDDLKRRDFSINALAISLNPQSLGLLLDPTNGAADIQGRRIHTLRNTSFLEDPVRLYRAVRLLARLQFTLESKTEVQFQQALESDLFESSPDPGVSREFRHLAYERDPVAILKAFDKHGLLEAFSPRLKKKGIDWQLFARAEKVRDTLAESGIFVRSFSIFLHLLSHKLSPGDTADLAKRLNLRKPELTALCKLHDEAKHLAKELKGKSVSTPIKLYQRLSAVSAELLLMVLLESSDRTVHSRIKTYLQKQIPLHSQLPVQEIIDLGVAANSPRFQKIQQEYFLASLQGKLRGRVEHNRFLKKMVQENK